MLTVRLRYRRRRPIARNNLIVKYHQGNNVKQKKKRNMVRKGDLSNNTVMRCTTTLANYGNLPIHTWNNQTAITQFRDKKEVAGRGIHLPTMSDLEEYVNRLPTLQQGRAHTRGSPTYVCAIDSRRDMMSY